MARDVRTLFGSIVNMLKCIHLVADPVVTPSVLFSPSEVLLNRNKLRGFNHTLDIKFQNNEKIQLGGSEFQTEVKQLGFTS